MRPDANNESGQEFNSDQDNALGANPIFTAMITRTSTEGSILIPVYDNPSIGF